MPISLDPFYHNHLRNIILTFGTLFNNIKVQRPNGDVILVPLMHGNKEKYYLRKSQDAGRHESIVLPRLGFVISGIEYDPTRKLNTTGIIEGTASSTSKKVVFQPAPYNVNIDMYCWTRMLDDSFQITEQILPFFKPSLAITITELSEPLIKRDIIFNLTSINFDNQIEGAFDDIRILETVYSFSVEAGFYGPVKDQNIIREVIINTLTGIPPQVNVKVTGTATPDDALPTDDWDYVEVMEEFNN